MAFVPKDSGWNVFRSISFSTTNWASGSSFLPTKYGGYCDDSTYLDKQVRANSIDLDLEQSDQGLRCLPFYLHLLNTSL